MPEFLSLKPESLVEKWILTPIYTLLEICVLVIAVGVVVGIGLLFKSLGG